MKIPIKLYLTALLSCTSLFSSAQDFSEFYQEFQSSEVLAKYYYGFSLYDVAENAFVLDINGDKHFTPASNAKIYTLYTSLLSLPDSIPAINYVERGDSLLIWGTGDPTFLHSKLDNSRLFNFLKGSKKQLFILATKQDGPAYAPGWAMEDYTEYYQPEISTFPIYGNVATFRKRGNGPLKVIPAAFQGALYFTQDTGKFALSRDFHENRFRGSNSHVAAGYVNEIPFITSPELTAALLSDTLGRPVQVLHQEIPSNGKVLYSLAAKQVYREMMLPSDNFLAEQLFLMSSQAKLGYFSTAKMQQWMKRRYYSSLKDKIDLYDGSGLSTYNKITPRATVEVLLRIKNLLPNFSDVQQLFPTGGVDGTLRSAYQLDLGEPFIWAKTGTINSVHNQSGYIRTRTGKLYIYSFLNNNFMEPTSVIRKEMVRIMTALRKNY